MTLPRGGKVRCNRRTPSPFVRLAVSKQECCPLALDLGCGNGRNSRHLLDSGFSVMAFDKFADQYGEELDLGRQPLPVGYRAASLILCSYLLMFLDQAEREHLLAEINRVARVGGSELLVELYPAKQSHCPNDGTIALLRSWLDSELNANGWRLRMTHGRNHMAYTR